MNIIELIKNNLSGNALGQLGSLIGASPEQTKAAAGAAVPSILAGLGKAASTKSGADNLTDLLNNLDPKLTNNPGGMFTGGDTSKLGEAGAGMLDKILGGGVLAGLGGLLSKFSGLGGDMMKKLLAYLAPLILGVIAKQFGGKASAQGLTQFFTEQKSNIASAMPAGLSLSSLPGFGDVSASAQKAVDSVKQTNPLSWITPILLVALGIVLWFYLKPVEPVNLPGATDLAKNITKAAGTSLTDSINTFFTSTTESLNSIKDVASADAAIPKLKELTGQVDEMKKGFALVPETGKAAIKTLLGSNLDKLKAIVDKLLAMPVVGEKLKPILEPLMAKLASITG